MTRTSFATIVCLLTASVAQAAGPYLYVGNNGVAADSVSVIDLSIDTVIATVPTGNRTGTVAVSADGTRAYANNTFADGISVIDTVTNAVIDTLSQPYIALAMLVNYARAEMYSNIIGTDLVKVTPTSGAPGTNISLGGARPTAFATNWLGTRLFTANGLDDSVSVIDTATQQVLSTIPVGDAPSAIRANLSGNLLFVSGAAGTDVVDVGSGTVVTTLSGGAAIALNPAVNKLWRLSGGQLCSFNINVSPPAPGPCGTISVATSAGMIFDPSGSRLYVASYSTDTVQVFDMRQGTAFPLLTTIPVGDSPVIGSQSIVASVGHDAVIGSGEWSGTLFGLGGDSILQLMLTFYDSELDAFGTPINFGTLIGDQASLIAVVGPGQPPISRTLTYEMFSSPINMQFADGVMRCDDGCTTNGVILSGRLIDFSGTLPSGIGFRIEGNLQASEPLTSSSNVAVAGTFNLTAIASANTPVGRPVTVHGGSSDIPVSVTFTEVTQAGSTIIDVNLDAGGVLPANFGLNLPPLFITISTDATVIPPFTVCIGYGSTNLSDTAAHFVTLWHAPDGAYNAEQTTVDEDNDLICAVVTSLSPFALAQPQPPRTGFVPVDKTAAKCEAGLSKAAARLTRGIGKCHIDVASDALAGHTPAEESCEADARAKFDEKVASLVGCPACVTAGASDLRDRTEQLMNGLNTGIYCDGTTLVGSDNLGSVPPDATSAACAKKVVKAVGKRANALARCHKRAAKAGVVGKFFDVDACEADAAAKFAATPLDGCPQCLTNGLRAIGVQLESSLDRDNGLAFCGGVTPFP